MAIQSGAGKIEWTREIQRIEPGTAFILLPGQWHRYRPDAETGWTEDWFELKGELVQHWLRNQVFAKRIFRITRQRDFCEEVTRLHEICRNSSTFNTAEAAALAMLLLCNAIEEASIGSGKKADAAHRDKIARARDCLAEGKSVAATAAQLGMSYPSLNRIFKRMTGIPPKTYANQLRLARAESMLGEDRLSIKEIAASLGFHSANHFSSTFRKAYGIPPHRWRRRLLEP